MSFKDLRIYANLDIVTATRQLEISVGTLYKIEEGVKRPSTRLIEKMTKVYKCDYNEIFKALKVQKR